MQDLNMVQQSKTYKTTLAELIQKSLTTVNLKVTLWEREREITYKATEKPTEPE